MLNILVVDYMYVYIDLHALLTNNFEHRVLRIELIINAVLKGVLVGVLNLHVKRFSAAIAIYFVCAVLLSVEFLTLSLSKSMNSLSKPNNLKD